MSTNGNVALDRALANADKAAVQCAFVGQVAAAVRGVLLSRQLLKWAAITGSFYMLAKGVQKFNAELINDFINKTLPSREPPLSGACSAVSNPIG